MTDGRTDRIASTVTRSAHADGQQKVKKNTHTHTTPATQPANKTDQHFI